MFILDNVQGYTEEMVWLAFDAWHSDGAFASRV
jgi:hypothetical protein